MFLTLQVILLFMMVYAAFITMRSIRWQRSASWADQLRRIRYHNTGLAEVSHGCLFSEGVDTDVIDLKAAIGGNRGLWRIFCNTGILMDALDHIETFSKSNVQFGVCIERLNTEGREVRVSTMMCIVGSGIWAKREVVLLALERYLAFVAHTSMAIQDFHPQLLSDYLEVMECAWKTDSQEV